MYIHFKQDFRIGIYISYQYEVFELIKYYRRLIHSSPFISYRDVKFTQHSRFR